ncbi:MAG: type II secretion system protein D [Betaproteobacteria bacterium]|nr:type II secretion system protein D [Betaproteobacteria bacterium]
MPRTHRLYGLLLLAIEVAIEAALGGCATHGALSTTTPAPAVVSTPQTLKSLQSAAQKKPGDISLQEQYYMQREQSQTRWLLQAQQALSDGKLDDARDDLHKVMEVDPHSPMATGLLARLQQTQSHRNALQQARQDLSARRFEQAHHALRQILEQYPSDTQAQELLRQVRDAQRKQDLAHALDAKYAQEKVSLEFQSAPLRSVFYALSQQSGLNFSFDPGVPLDANATLYATDTPVLNVLDLLLSTHHLRQHVLNGNTIGIAAERSVAPPALGGGPEMKAFYLTNARPKQVQTLLRSMTTLRNVYIDDALNLVVVKGSRQEIQTARQLIAMVDMAPPEVMLDVEVLEVKQDLLRNLGVEYPNQFGLLNVPPVASSVTTPTGTTITTPPVTPLTVQNLRSISASVITINQIMLNLQDNSGNVKLLANPRIRVKNQVQAQIKIGEKVPVFNSNTTPTGVISSSVSYLDVGLDLKVKPTVMLDGDVQIQIALDVSNILNQVAGSNGAVGYQIGTRDANTTLRLADGQTQMLAGLISDEHQRTYSGIPGLGRIPVAGRLFSDHQDSNSKTEIVLLITPHIVRSLDVTPASDTAPLPAVQGTSVSEAGPRGVVPTSFREPMSSTTASSTSTTTESSPIPPGLPPGFIPPGTRLPAGFMKKPVPAASAAKR